MVHNHDFINSAALAIKQAAESGIALLSESEWIEITKAYNIFTKSLLTHIQSEDSILYQHAENNIGKNGLFYRLISDHIQIKEFVEKGHSALKINDAVRFLHLFEQLDKLIEEHTIREETLMGSNSENLETSAIQVISILRKLHVN